MNDYKEMLFRMHFHYENVPAHLQEIAKRAFVKARNVAAPIFNDLIGSVNKEWDKTGKPASFGKFLEDMNPEYIEFISAAIQPRFDEALADAPIRIVFGKGGDLEGTIKGIENSKIWIDMTPI